MVEAGANELSEEEMLGAIMFGHEAIKKLCAFQEQIIAEIGKPKRVVELYTIPQELIDAVTSLCKERIVKSVSIVDKLERQDAIDAIEKEVAELYENKEYPDEKTKNFTVKQVKEVMEGFVRDEVRRLITYDKVRPDGRQLDEIRPLDAQVDLLPRTHGSAMFTRGQTQVISVCTLGAQR